MNPSPIDARIVLFVTDEYKPCHDMAACLERLTAEIGDLPIESVDASLRPDLVVKHEVMVLPTAILMIDGRETVRFAGLRSERFLRRQLDRHLNPAVIGQRHLRRRRRLLLNQR